MTLSDYLKQLQGSDKQLYFAIKIGLSQSHYCALVNGKASPQLQALKRIAKYTGRSIDDLVNTFNL